MNLFRFLTLALVSASLLAGGALAAEPEALLIIKNHKFEPAELKVPADRKSTRLNSSHIQKSRMPSSA